VHTEEEKYWPSDINQEITPVAITRWKDHDEYQEAFTRLLRDFQTQ
jgi:hypothetical protein